MRKLSKKISMLMVLAMLVSLFSGVVSASAASSWSFYDRTAEKTVERNDTYVMEKDQYANFDLYKDGAEASTKEYKYTWYSDDASVVYVDSTNGRLRAQKDAEAGEKAFIYVLIDNKSTEKNENAKRGFYIEIADDEVVEEEAEYKIESAIADITLGEAPLVAGEKYEITSKVVDADGEAVADAVVKYTIAGKDLAFPLVGGEYIIVATATLEDDVLATSEIAVLVVENEITDVTQKDAKTAEIEFAYEISEEAAKNIELYLGNVAKNNYKKAIKVKDNVATFESYATFGNKKDWTFKFGESEYVMTSSQGEVDTVVITGPEFVYLKKDGAVSGTEDITFDCFDALGVKVPMSDTAYIEWKVDGSDATLVGDSISFSEKDKVATLSGIYHTGKFDEANNWEEITITIDEYVVTSVDNNDAAMIAISGKGVSNGDAKYDSLVVPVNGNGYKLFVKFKFDDAKGSEKTAAELGVDDEGKQIVTYESTNTSKLIVDPLTAELIPLSEGVVDVVVNVKGEFFGVVSVKVDKAEASTTPVVKASATQISNSSALNQSVKYEVTGKNNYGGDHAYTITKIEVVSDPFNPKVDDEKALKDELAKGNTSAFVTGIDTNAVTVSVQAGGDYLKAGNYIFKLTIKAADQKEYTQNVSVYVRAADAEDPIKSVAVEFVDGKNAYDTAANKDTADFDAKVAFKLVGKNKDSVAVKYLDATAVSGGTMEIKLGSDKVAYEIDGDTFVLSLYAEDAENGIYTIDGANYYAAIKNGTYVITGKADGLTIPNTAFTVANNQAAPAITNETAALSVAAATTTEELLVELAKCFKAPDDKDGEYSFGDITIKAENVKWTSNAENTVIGEYVVRVEKVNITQTFEAGAMVDYEVAVNQTITLTVTE